MYEGQLEIESYQIGAWYADEFAPSIALFLSNGTPHHIVLKTRSQAHGNRYTIALWFSDAVEGPGVGTIVQATETATGKKVDLVLIGLPESYYADIYAILRAESPVFFTYLCDEPFPRPLQLAGASPGLPGERPALAEQPIIVRAVKISTETEPVGEGIDFNAVGTHAGIGAIIRRFEGLSGEGK